MDLHKENNNMNALQQFLAQLNTELGDNEELKVKLADGFKAVQTAFDTTKERTDKLGITADNQAKVIKLVASKLNVDEITEDSISEAIKGLSKNKDEGIEALKTKHEDEVARIRDTFTSELKAKDEAFNTLGLKLNDTLFKTSIIDSGLLDGFVDEPMARNNIIGQIKDSLIYEDGKIFVKDNSTGEKAKDNMTGEYLSPESVVQNLQSTINPMYLTADIKANGGGTPPNQTTPTGKKFSDYTSAELVALNRTNPTAYQALKNAQ